MQIIIIKKSVNQRKHTHALQPPFDNVDDGIAWRAISVNLYICAICVTITLQQQERNKPRECRRRVGKQVGMFGFRSNNENALSIVNNDDDDEEMNPQVTCVLPNLKVFDKR
jgi:hypothetical protein